MLKKNSDKCVYQIWIRNHNERDISDTGKSRQTDPDLTRPKKVTKDSFECQNIKTHQ
jgi:hypothetical protein